MRFKALIGLALCILTSTAQAQERAWSLDAAGEDAFLVYGVPESEDVGVSIWCKIGTGNTSLFFPVTWTMLNDGETIPVVVKLGDAEFKLQGTVTAGASPGEVSVESALPSGDSFFDALKTSDRIKLDVAQHISVYPLIDIQVDGLLKLCREPAAAQ